MIARFTGLHRQSKLWLGPSGLALTFCSALRALLSPLRLPPSTKNPSSIAVRLFSPFYQTTTETLFQPSPPPKYCVGWGVKLYSLTVSALCTSPFERHKCSKPPIFCPFDVRLAVTNYPPLASVHAKYVRLHRASDNADKDTMLAPVNLCMSGYIYILYTSVTASVYTVYLYYFE